MYVLSQDPLRSEFFLSPAEEATIRRYYENQLLKFCHEFSPPMPMYVMVRRKLCLQLRIIRNSLMVVSK